MNALFVANFGTGTGYAWNTIERVFRGVGEAIIEAGGEAAVCYASLDSGPPAALEGSSVGFVGFDYSTVGTVSGLRAFTRLLRDRRVDVLYLTDRPTWSPTYPFFRLAGVQEIVVHDRTSGTRRSRSGLASVVKRLIHRVPGLSADRCVGVSEFVTRRLRRIGGVPRSRTVCVYNGIDLAPYEGPDPTTLHRELGESADRSVVFFAGRVQPYKGVGVLIEAAERLARAGSNAIFVCCGDGTALEGYRAQVEERGLNNFVFLGKRADVARLLPSASVAVVPSLWEEAFGLTVVEAMAAGVPVVASRVGGIPELIDDDETGVLVEPGDPIELASALEDLLSDAPRAEAMGRRGRATAHARFSIDRTIDEIVRLLIGNGGTAHASLTRRQ